MPNKMLRVLGAPCPGATGPIPISMPLLVVFALIRPLMKYVPATGADVKARIAFSDARAADPIKEVPATAANNKLVLEREKEAIKSPLATRISAASADSRIREAKHVGAGGPARSQSLSLAFLKSGLVWNDTSPK